MDNRIGVLLVHGIGKQEQGATLSQFGDPLIRWLRAWAEGHEGDLTELPSSDESGPQHVRLRWKCSPTQSAELVVAECWWADAFNAPSAGEVLSWLPAVGYRLLFRMGRVFLPLLLVLAAVSYVLLAPIAAVFQYLGAWSVYLALAIAILIPLSPLLILVALWLLTLPFAGGIGHRVNDTVGAVIGDAWVLTHSPTRFSRMRRRFAKELRWLQSRADAVVVVAHSQGSVVAVEALREWTDLPCDMLVTVGSAVRLLNPKEQGGALAFKQARPSCRWVDISSPFDPVSAGSICDTGSYPVDVNVQNPGSILNAHTSYFRNPEGCLAVIQAALGFVAAGRTYFSQEAARAVRRAIALRQQRGQMRGIARLLSGAASVGIAVHLAETNWPQRFATGAAAILWTWAGDLVTSAAGHFYGVVAISLTCGLSLVMLYDSIVVSPLHNLWHRRAASALAGGRRVPRIDPAGIAFLISALPLAAVAGSRLALGDTRPLSVVLGLSAALLLLMLVVAAWQEPHFAKDATLSGDRMDDALSDVDRDAFAPFVPAFKDAIYNYSRCIGEWQAARTTALRDAISTFIRDTLAGSATITPCDTTTSDISFSEGYTVTVALGASTPVPSLNGFAATRYEDGFELTVGTIYGDRRSSAFVLAISRDGHTTAPGTITGDRWTFYVLSEADVLKLKSGVLSVTLLVSTLDHAGHKSVPLSELRERVLKIVDRPPVRDA